MKSIILITGASSGFGALAARALARSGHTVYASMRGTTGRNARQVKEVQKFASENNVDLRAVELDVASQESADTAIQTIIAECGRLDIVIHNAGHMVFGPAEAFTTEQYAELYDINVQKLRILLRRECLRRPKNHVPGIVYHNVQTSAFSDYRLNGGVGRFLRCNVEFDCAQVHVVFRRELFHFLHLLGVASGGAAHTCVHR